MGNLIGSLNTRNMENMEKSKRNINIGTKVSFEEKHSIQRVANAHNISVYELIHTLVMNYKDQYEFIGQTSPKEEVLIQALEVEKKKTRKLTQTIENAENRIGIEQEINKKAQNKVYDLTRNINHLNAELKTKNDQINDLLVSKRKLDEVLGNQQTRQLHNTSLASMVLAGISLLFVPFIYKN